MAYLNSMLFLKVDFTAFKVQLCNIS